MADREPETCAECGFDSARWRRQDAGTLLSALGLWWGLATTGVPATALNARPAPGVWSALEYGMHSSFVTAVMRHYIERIAAEDGIELAANWPAPADASAHDPVVLERDAIVNDLSREGDALFATLRATPDDRWTNVGRWGESARSAEWLLVHAAHDASHHQMDVALGLASIGEGTPPQSGRVARINTSAGGVPKLAIAGAHIDHDGVRGDVQADRKHHGRPFQALCLWSTEVIDQLAGQGHPIAPGCAGENLTLTGIDWSTLRPGARMRIGSALAELSFPAVPCAKQARWFSDGDFQRIAHERNPQFVRWYAWVREAGDVSTGDAVIVQP